MFLLHLFTCMVDLSQSVKQEKYRQISFHGCDHQSNLCLHFTTEYTLTATDIFRQTHSVGHFPESWGIFKRSSLYNKPINIATCYTRTDESNKV